MFPKTIFVIIVILALVSLACGITINVPVEQMSTGPNQTETINVPVPDASPANLELTFGAGELKINPGAEDALVEGTATYNVEDLKPNVDVEGRLIRIKTGDFEINGLPSIRAKDVKNIWDIKLGDAAMKLAIKAGAYQGTFELGGLSLTWLEVSDGAADVRLKFSQPNRVEMEKLQYITGASNVKLSGLANANFTSMVFRSGAGDYTLDFSGTLQRDAEVKIESGVSQVTIIVPAGVSAVVTFRAGISNIDTSGDWEKSGNEYYLTGSGPTLNITVDMGAGNLNLRTAP